MRRVKPETRNLAIMAATVAVLAAAVAFARREGDVRILPPETRDVTAARTSPDNAFYKLRMARDLMSKVRATPETEQNGPARKHDNASRREPVHEGLSTEDTAVKEALERYGPAINAARNALEKPYYLCRNVPNVRENLAEDVDFRGLAHLLAVRGEEQARAGKTEGAFADLLDAVQLGRMVASDGPLVGYCAGHDMQVDALKRVPGAAHEATSREILVQALDDFSNAVAPPPLAPALEFGWRMLDNSVGLPRESRTSVRAPRESAKPPTLSGQADGGAVRQRQGGADSPSRASRDRGREGRGGFLDACRFTWELRRGQRFIIRNRQHLLDIAALPYPAYRDWQEDRPEMAAADHPFCDIAGGLDALQQFHASMEAWGAGAELALALELYRWDYGAYPEDPDALAEYLTPVPLDPFTEEPFVYWTEGEDYWLYSLGANGLDDGGEDGPGGDLVIHRPDTDVRATGQSLVPRSSVLFFCCSVRPVVSEFHLAGSAGLPGASSTWNDGP